MYIAMKKKKKPVQAEKKAVRLQKAKKWIANYQGSRKNIAGNYKLKFHVDILTAVNDLKDIGVEFTEEYLEAVKKSEQDRIKKKQENKAKKKGEVFDDDYEYKNDVFAFIAGYTSGGAPYGTTWEELGLKPYASADDITAAYDRIFKEVRYIDWDNVKQIMKSWIMRINEAETLPDGMRALNFSIYESYGVELTGSFCYAPFGDDWIREGNFVPKERSCPQLGIDETCSWKEVLEGMEEIIFELVQELEDLPILQVKHITAGFFDGDMILIK